MIHMFDVNICATIKPMQNSKIIVVSLPRSGSSLVTQLIASAGYRPSLFSENSFEAHEFNKHGYFEDVSFTLLNDQLIKLYYGNDYSFLYPPSYDDFKKGAESREDKFPNGFEYDVDKTNVFIPKGFTKNVENFTGTDWDVWGITRMINGGKWEKCYSRNNMETKKKILKQKKRYKDMIDNANFNFVLKDPRIALSMPLYDFNGIKIVWIKRNGEDTMKSMRKHYGPRMFTENLIPGTKYVSNHFNLKVKHMAFNEYLTRYEKAIEYSLSRHQHLIIEFDDLINLRNVEKLEDFIGADIDKSLCRQNS